MTIPAVAIVYTDEETIVRKLTELGQEQALNDIDSADQVDILDEFIADASSNVNFYLGRRYEPEQLVLARKVWSWTTCLAIYFLMSRGGATPPMIVQRCYAQSIEEMKMVAKGWPIPGIQTSVISAPIVHGHETNPLAARNTSPPIHDMSLDESGELPATPWYLDLTFVPFDFL